MKKKFSGKQFAKHAGYQEEESSTFSHNGKRYSVNRLIALARKVEPVSVPMASLRWNVTHDLDEDRVKRADVRVPIVASKSGAAYYVHDGKHRLKKQFDQGKTSVMVRVISQDDLKSCLLK